MNKKSYLFGIYFLGLTVASGLFSSFIHFQLGSQMRTLESLKDYLLVMNVISLLASMVVLKYFHYKNYRFALIAGVLYVLATFSSVAIFYAMSSLMQLMKYYLPSIIITIPSGVIYGTSLIFSNTRERFWLRIAGIFTFIINAVLLSSIVLWIYSPEIQTNGTLERIIQWTSLANSLIPVWFIMNFLIELRSIKVKETHESIQKYTAYGMLIVGVLALALILFYGSKVISEKTSKTYWKERDYALAQELAQLFEARIFVGSKNDTLLYRLLKPLDYEPDKNYPLMVCLHHGGVHGNDNIEQLSSQPVPLLSTDYNRRKYPTFLFVPQCPKGSGFGRNPYSPSIDSLVFEAINELENEFSIDKNRRYVMGASGGGYGTWNFISTHPEMFAAAIPISGGGDPKFAENLSNVAIWAFHGEKDRLVPAKLSRDMIKAIKKAGGNPSYTEFAGKGHSIGGEVKATPGLFDWLFEQKRDNQK